MYNVRRATSSCFCIKVDIVELRAVLLSSGLGFGLGSGGLGLHIIVLPRLYVIANHIFCPYTSQLVWIPRCLTVL